MSLFSVQDFAQYVATALINILWIFIYFFFLLWVLIGSLVKEEVNNTLYLHF